MNGVVIAGTHSGCGKTTVTLGILAALRKKGCNVQPFKTGPDFIDTGLHTLVTGRTSRNLDLWMCGSEYVRECFTRHSADADVSVVEGVMGMYDGNMSTADLAAALGLGVILVVDAYGMAESAGAVVKGFTEYSAEAQKSGSTEGQDFRTSVLPRFRSCISGVIFNRVASERHFRRIKDSIHGIPVLGYLPRSLEFNIPHRHLGLITAEEAPVDKKEIDRLADAIIENIDIDTIAQKSGSAEVLKEKISGLPIFRSSGLKIGVAYDRAFCFYYQDNLDMLEREGAEIIRFSPLSDSRIPDGLDALYIGGGYPELHAEQLSGNTSMLESVRDFAEIGMPVYAECGGFMYLTGGIHDFEDRFHPMAGTFPFKTAMKKGRASLGYREAVLKNDCILGDKGTAIRGHEFHYSEIVKSSDLPRFRSSALPIYSVKDGSGNSIQDEGYMIKNTLGSYIHIHFGSTPFTAKKIIDFIREHNGKDYHCRTR